MGSNEADGLPDPGRVSTAEDLAAGLKQLLNHQRLTGKAVAEKTGLANSTISTAINGKTVPRRDTVDEIVRAGCGQDPKPWLDAWERAKRDKRKKTSVEELAALVDGMESRIDSLDAALRDAVARIDALESENADLRTGKSVAKLGEERQARASVATDRVMELLQALSQIDVGPKQKWLQDTRAGLDRGPEPEWHHAEVDSWRRMRSSLIDALRFASVDIIDDDLRLRLSDAIQMMEFYGGPEKHAGQAESVTRIIAVQGALEATGAYRRGQELPSLSPDFLDTLEFANMYEEEIDIISGSRGNKSSWGNQGG
ncbi:helix-turn-helix domain-containing protein [Kitasatospora sp. NPDC101157]|uniref:helix-turn-helix domain-containing protein n=1 Tax=Kitasatospora sp. NPDC101157 TaxID=3364098 RepID=UPI0038147E75